MKRNIQELCLRFGLSQGRDVVPPCLFRCETLKKLRLDELHDFIVPSSACLPSLKDLSLESVWFVDGASVQNLFLASPALESLSIECCHWKEHVTISAPNLQGFSIQDYGDHGSGKLIIYGPTVKSFSYYIDLPYQYCLVGSSSLNEARLSIGGYVNLLSEFDGFSDMLKSLSKVRSLTLSGALFKGDSNVEDLLENLPTFFNMMELKVDMLLDFLGSKELATLLGKCPCLRTLEIDQRFVEGISQALEPVPSCFQSKLKKIVVRYVSFSKENVDCVGLLLSKATVLEEMVLYYSGSIKDACKVAELMKLPKGSRKCKISLIL